MPSSLPLNTGRGNEASLTPLGYLCHSKWRPNRDRFKPASFLLSEGQVWVRMCEQIGSVSATAAPVPTAGITNGAPISFPRVQRQPHSIPRDTISLSVLEPEMKLIWYPGSKSNLPESEKKSCGEMISSLSSEHKARRNT